MTYADHMDTYAHVYEQNSTWSLYVAVAIVPPMLTAAPVPTFDSISESGCIEEMPASSGRVWFRKRGNSSGLCYMGQETEWGGESEITA